MSILDKISKCIFSVEDCGIDEPDWLYLHYWNKDFRVDMGTGYSETKYTDEVTGEVIWEEADEEYAVFLQKLWAIDKLQILVDKVAQKEEESTKNDTDS